MRDPEDRGFLRVSPDHRTAAVTEVARWLGPLPELERLRAGAGDPAGRVLLGFVSGNVDATRFPDPETLDVHRGGTHPGVRLRAPPGPTRRSADSPSASSSGRRPARPDLARPPAG